MVIFMLCKFVISAAERWVANIYSELVFIGLSICVDDIFPISHECIIQGFK